MDEHRPAERHARAPVSDVGVRRRVVVGAVDEQEVDRALDVVEGLAGELAHLSDPVGDARGLEVAPELLQLLVARVDLPRPGALDALRSRIRVDRDDLDARRRGQAEDDRRAAPEAPDLDDPLSRARPCRGVEQHARLSVREPAGDLGDRSLRGCEPLVLRARLSHGRPILRSRDARGRRRRRRSATTAGTALVRRNRPGSRRKSSSTPVSSPRQDGRLAEPFAPFGALAVHETRTVEVVALLLAAAAVRDHERAAALELHEVEEPRGAGCAAAATIRTAGRGRTGRRPRSSPDGRRTADGVAVRGVDEAADRRLQQRAGVEQLEPVQADDPERLRPARRRTGRSRRGRGRGCHGPCSSRCRRRCRAGGSRPPTGRARSGCERRRS